MFLIALAAEVTTAENLCWRGSGETERSELLDASGKSHLLSAEYLLLLLLGGLKTRVGAGGDGLSHSSSSSSSSSSLLLLLLLLESVLSEEEELCMLLTEVTVQGPC